MPNNRKDKEIILDNLIAENDNWVFKSFEIAKKYAELFFRLNTIYYAGFPSAVMFRTVGDCLKYALQKDYISEDDLYTTDKIVLEKVKSFLNKDEKLKLFWERMNNKNSAKNNPDNYDTRVYCKSRIVDPLCLHNKKILKISDIDKKWKEIIRRESKPKEYFLKFDR